MRYLRFLTGAAIIAVIGLSGCTTTPAPPIPDPVLAMHPENGCDEWAQDLGWDLRAELYETDTNSYLIIHFDPGFDLVREPSVHLEAGFAIFEKQDSNTYYYRLGKIPKSIRIGVVSFETPARVRSRHGSVPEIVRLALERQQGKSCLRVIGLQPGFNR
jgi:hypothetical protein